MRQVPRPNGRLPPTGCSHLKPSASFRGNPIGFAWEAPNHLVAEPMCPVIWGFVHTQPLPVLPHLVGRRLGNAAYHVSVGFSVRAMLGREGEKEGPCRLQAPVPPFHPAAQGCPLPSVLLQASVCDKAPGWLVGPWRRDGCLQAERALPGSPLTISQGALSRDLRARRDPNLAICWKQRSNICISRPSALETKYFLLGSGLEPPRADVQT